jgi:hypothetical protein
MKRLLVLCAVTAFASCSADSPQPAACSKEGLGAWVAAPDTVLACTQGALSLAILGASNPQADGRTMLQVAVRVGLDFRVSGTSVDLTASGAGFSGMSTDGKDTPKTTVTTDASGVALASLRVGNAAGPLVVFGRVTTQNSQSIGSAEATLSLDVAPAPLRRVLLATDAGTLAKAGTTSVSVLGFSDDELRYPAAKSPVELCLGSQEGISSALTRKALDDAGTASFTVFVAGSVAEGATFRLRACPLEAHCGDNAIACDTQTLVVHGSAALLERLALTLDSTAMRAGEKRRLAIAGFADQDYLSRVTGGAVQLCANAPAALSASFATLDSSGNAEVELVVPEPMPADQPLRVAACPYGLDCDASPLSPRCAALSQEVLPAKPSISLIVLSLGARLVEGEDSELTIATFADTAGTQSSGAGQPLRVCVPADHATPTPVIVLLGSDGQAKSKIQPLLGSAAAGPIEITVCPYSIPCTAPSAPCGTMEASIFPKVASDRSDAGAGP